MKKNKKISNSLFWLKHLLLALMIIAIAVVLLVMQQKYELAERPDGAGSPKNISNNLSDFYADYRSSSSVPREEELGEFVMAVKVSDKPLNERLKKMESLQKPISKIWVGEHKYRTFKAGDTLRSAITNYAQSEGMQLIWELDKDFIVKHPFQLDDSILGSLKMIAKTIDANFDGEVKAYMCPRQRSMVITSKLSEYLTKNCAEARK
jgi:hypothetical protein